jgi:hypothetical protein
MVVKWLHATMKPIVQNYPNFPNIEIKLWYHTVESQSMRQGAMTRSLKSQSSREYLTIITQTCSSMEAQNSFKCMYKVQ